jgi:hypothetical protein
MKASVGSEFLVGRMGALDFFEVGEDVDGGGFGFGGTGEVEAGEGVGGVGGTYSWTEKDWAALSEALRCLNKKPRRSGVCR